MKTARDQEYLGSALTLMGLIREIAHTVLHPLFNQRGQAGESDDDPTNPGEDALEHDTPSSDEAGDDNEPAADDGDTPADAGTDQEPTDTTQDQTPAEPQSNVDELNQRIAQLEADKQQAEQMAQFYSQFYQQGQQQDAIPGQPPGQQPGQQAQNQPPSDVINPGDWEDQEQTASWVNHQIQNQAQQLYQAHVIPALQQLSTAIQGLQMATAKGGKEDWDDVYSEAIKEIFTMAPDGNVIGVKNQALLSYFRSQANPFEAMYQYGLTKKTPDKIKQQVQANTKKAIESIGKKPKGPTTPKGGGKDGKPDTELDWDTPPDQAEKVLAKKGLI